MHLSKHRDDVCRNGCLVFCQLHLHYIVQGVHSASVIGEFSVYYEKINYPTNVR